jgi:glutaminyl-peptide cyclotransferase
MAKYCCYLGVIMSRKTFQMRPITLFLLLSWILFSCGSKQEKRTTTETPLKKVSVPPFNSDSAYLYVDKQVKFGPRVPDTKAHRQTGDYLIAKLKKFGASVKVQEFEAYSFDGHKLPLRNIIGSYNPQKQKRILLSAHWDTRPFADKDSLKKDAAFDGANDGASGAGILLEVARQLNMKSTDVGVDIILFDGEDWGEKDKESGRVQPPEGYESWWCLGSQYWAKHRHQPNYSAYFGILLDMAGGKGAHFYQEGMSQRYAPKVVEKVWRTAERLGYSSYFVMQNQSGIQDDHVFVNEVANIPMVDIVDYQPGIGYFGDYHHSRKDNMSLISKETLAAVGNVLLTVIYSEE